MTDDPAREKEGDESDRMDAIDAADASDDQPCADQPLETRIEALLLSTDRPLTEQRLASLLGLSGKGSAAAVKDAMAALNEQYEQTERSFRAERLAGGWQLLTIQAFAPLLARLHTDRQQTRLSQAALETLAIVAYRQPIMRAEIEAIRGVASGEVLRSLMERRMIKITGRAEELGRPMLYGTTNEFLKVFGLSSVDDLPDVQGLREGSAGASGTSSRTKSDQAETDAADAAEAADEHDDKAEPHAEAEAAGGDAANADTVRAEATGRSQ